MEQDYADSNSGNQNNNNLALHTMSNINNATTSTIADMAVVNVVVFGD